MCTSCYIHPLDGANWCIRHLHSHAYGVCPASVPLSTSVLYSSYSIHPISVNSRRCDLDLHLSHPPLYLSALIAPLYSCLQHSLCLCSSRHLWHLRSYAYGALTLTLTHLKQSLGQAVSVCQVWLLGPAIWLPISNIQTRRQT